VTTEWRETAPCLNCGVPVSTEQPVKAWIRAHRDLDSRRACLCIGDSDLWVQKYGTRRGTNGVDREVMYIMLVEVKTHGRVLDDSQRELLGFVSELLRTKPFREQRINGRFAAGHRQNVRLIRSYSSGKRIPLYCYGVHVLQLSGSTPEDSKEITWDRRSITKEQLVGILRYDLDPDSLRKIEHHRPHKRKKDMEGLFDLAGLVKQISGSDG
jgi:hypothetical protein